MLLLRDFGIYAFYRIFPPQVTTRVRHTHACVNSNADPAAERSFSR